MLSIRPSEVSELLLIQVNGDRREVKEDTSLLELIVILNLRSEQVAIELNLPIAPSMLSASGSVLPREA